MLKQKLNGNHDNSQRLLKWRKQDSTWMLSLYGTAIGAGILFLPINAGLQGILPLFIMLFLSFFMIYFPHRALCRFVLSGSGDKDITHVFYEHFNVNLAKLLTFLYFFSIYPILLLYSVAITNTAESFIIHQLHLSAPPRVLLSFFLIMALMLIIYSGQEMIVKAMSILVYPFVTVLIILSLYLIPYWQLSVLTDISLTQIGTGSFLKTMWLIIPVMVFSFNHSAIISSFAVEQKKKYGLNADKKCLSILKRTHVLMVLTVMFFVFSCVLSLSPAELVEAKEQNITILSYLANHFNTPIIAYISPIIAFIAIAKSFLGHYLGAHEGLKKMLHQNIFKHKPPESYEKISCYLIQGIMIFSCWIAATLNPSILKMIEIVIGPVIASILFLMPMYAYTHVKSLKQYKKDRSNIFVTVVGLIAISSLIFGFWLI